jgi:indole-3-glycerol phosphate synthase
MYILDSILKHKRKEVERLKEVCTTKYFERSGYFDAAPVSLKKYLLRDDKKGIIAEIKRKSPSKGIINASISVEELSIGYMQGGASALSILTDIEFFGGSNEDLSKARDFNFCPILRKDFIIDTFQIIESKSIGADVILLIAAALTPEEVQSLSAFAKSLFLEVILEVHSEDELKRYLCETVDIIGVNNRNLKDFSVDYRRSLQLAPMIPKDYLAISESGISEVKAIRELKNAGYKGFLIGETFMKHSRPEIACQKFIECLDAE